MTTKIRSAFAWILAAAGVALSGCASSSFTVENARQLMTYQPQPTSTRIESSASVEVTYDIDQRSHDYWTGRALTEAEISSLRQAIAASIAADLVTSGPFARIVPAGSGQVPDYIVKVGTQSYFNPDERFSLALSIATGAEPGESVTLSRELVVGGRWLGPLLPQFFAETKPVIAAGVERLKQAAVERAEFAAMRNASLADLLRAADGSVALARERNRGLIEAKTRQLPAILRDSKSEDLTTLVVKIEQTILDLDHECEIAKDRAQQAVAASEAGATPPDGLRGLAISYRERIELLKPIVTALKDELVNRGR